MDKKELLRRRLFQLLLIAAWIALGTVMIVLRPHWWVWFAAVSYVIAIVYIVAEVLTWRRAMRQGNKPAERGSHEPPASDGQNSNTS